jgi:hypothetical protein
MKKILLILVIIACMFTAGCISNPYEDIDWPLTLVGADGTEKILSVSEIAALPSVSGHGYAVSTVGIKYGPYEITGVPLIELLNQVGGVHEGQTVHVSAADGYLWVFSYEQLLGEDLLCLDANLKEMKTPAKMTPILMYAADGKPYPYDDGGPLRMATMTAEPDVITEGSLWVKWVDRIEVHG